VVTGDGRAFNAGGRVVKNVAGFDLVRLLSGSAGTLALLTEVTMRLYPLPESDRTLVLRAPKLEELAEAALRACTQPVTPAAVELFERHLPIEERTEAMLAIHLVGGEERVAAEAEHFERLLGAEALSAAEAEAFWREIRRLDEGTDLSLRIALEPTRLTETIALAREVGRMRDGHDELAHTPLRIAAHAASGALRVAAPHIKVDSGWDEHWAERVDDLRRTLAWRGGTLTVSRAPTELLDRLPPAEPSIATQLTAGLKAVFDPAGILSVDRFLLGVGRDTRG
jgi:FAD/FMN-containing dehydrogenase